MNVADGLLRWPTARGQQSRAEQGKAGQGLLSDSANERGEAAVEGARDCAQCAGGEKLQSSRALSLSLPNLSIRPPHPTTGPADPCSLRYIDCFCCVAHYSFVMPRMIVVRLHPSS